MPTFVLAQRHTPDLPWRKDPVILDRLVAVEAAHLAGRSNRAIGRELGVDDRTIRRDLDRIRELWRERIGESIEDLKAKAVAELEDIKRRALAAADFDENTERAVIFGDGPDGGKVVRPEKGSVSFHGNKAAALNVARQAVMDQCKILGILVDRTETAPVNVILRTYDIDPD